MTEAERFEKFCDAVDDWALSFRLDDPAIAQSRVARDFVRLARQTRGRLSEAENLILRMMVRRDIAGDRYRCGACGQSATTTDFWHGPDCAAESMMLAVMPDWAARNGWRIERGTMLGFGGVEIDALKITAPDGRSWHDEGDAVSGATRAKMLAAALAAVAKEA